MPVPEYPLLQETITSTIEECDFSETLVIEENDVSPPTGWSAASYTLRRPEKDIYAGHCMGILSREKDDIRTLGINVTTIDGKEELSEEELEQAVIFATHLFGGFRNGKQVYKSLKKQVDMTSEFVWEKEIDGIACRVKYTPYVSAKLVISFSTN